MPYKEEEIGKALIKAKLITPEAFQKALDSSRERDKSIGQLLVQQGLVTEVQIAKAMELCYRVPYVNLKEHAVEPEALGLIPFHVAWEYQVLPMSVKNKYLTVAMADPEDVMTVDYLQNLTGYKIRVVFSDPAAISEAIKEFYEMKEVRPTAIVFSKAAPAPVGPYSQAVVFERLLFISGQIGLSAAGEFAGDTAAAQARQALENMAAILKEAGSDFGKILKTTIFLSSMDDYKAVNEIYAGFFKGNFPARSAVAVKGLPRGALVEIEAVAHL